MSTRFEIGSKWAARRRKKSYVLVCYDSSLRDRFFITVILSGMGWNLEFALLLSAPPYVFAALSVFVFAWLSDHFRLRAIFLAAQTILTLVGFAITGFVE
ncbi:hypothetical protein F5051DRAFT_445860 [Lentinula edodes]|nr:hypothetical protein F5051DRAFT_445860 [Lentinula edodes]